jgi:hypothetical protein
MAIRGARYPAHLRRQMLAFVRAGRAGLATNGITGFTLLAMALALCACVSVRRTYTQNGQPAYSLACSSVFSSWQSCLVKAGRLCGPRGYSVSFNDEVERLFIITCKTPDE